MNNLTLNNLTPSDSSIHSPKIVRFKTPTENGGILAAPPLHSARNLAQKNSAALEKSPLKISGKSISEFRKWTRQILTEVSQRWMLDVLGVERSAKPGLLYVTGHQPTLNHPGVWAKNIVTSHLAKCAGTTGLNLIVDNDLAGPGSIRVPAGTPLEPHFDHIEFDATTESQPWEERQQIDPELLTSFPDRVRSAMSRWNIEPVLTSCWQHALQTMERTSLTYPILTACRVELEQHDQVENLELPVSEMCQTEPFLAFVLDLVQQSDRFFEAYNQSVEDYRQTYKVRNHRHPVPNLERVGDLIELPFWYWKPGATDRSRVFVRKIDESTFQLFADETEIGVVPAFGHDLTGLVELQKHGKLRTRALTTTLFSRLCFADLFIHGIGGAKYDEITDLIFQRFYGFEAPGFMTVTATLRLPVHSYPCTLEESARLRQEMNSFRHLGPVESQDPAMIALQTELKTLIQSAKNQREAGLSKSQRRLKRYENRQRHVRIKELQREIEMLGQVSLDQAENSLNLLQSQIAANRILKSREYSMCLFPRQELDRLVSLLKVNVCGNSFKFSGASVAQQKSI